MRRRVPQEQLDTAITDFNEAVKSIEAQCETPGADMGDWLSNSKISC